MYDYCESSTSRDARGRPDPDCGRFYEEQADRDRGRHNKALKAAGAGLKAMGGSPSTSCTSRGIGNTVLTDCDQKADRSAPKPAPSARHAEVPGRPLETPIMRPQW
jgi:hypothetical protein